MKKILKLTGIIALVLVIGFLMAACDDLSKDGQDGGGGGSYDSGFTDIEAFDKWLSAQSNNTPNTAYNVKLKVAGFAYGWNGRSIGAILKDNPNKYVSLDLSGSTGMMGIGLFSGCTSLTGIIYPDNAEDIQGGTFEGCTNLASITISKSVTVIYAGDTFKGCEKLTSIDIPDNVSVIYRSVFSYCTGLKNITIGSGITSLGIEGDFLSEPTFIGCTNLTSVTIKGKKGVTRIGTYAFSGCTNLTNVNIQNCDSITGFSGCTGLTSLTIGDGVNSIGEQAFNGCTSLTSVNIPDSVTGIGGDAFKGCTNLIVITIPDSVTNIGGGAFSGCTGLTSVTISNSVPALGADVFYGCTSLTSVTIPNSVNRIGRDAFAGCSSLTRVKFEGTIDQYNFDGWGKTFPGDLRDKYLAEGGGIGTYTRPSGIDTWTKQTS